MTCPGTAVLHIMLKLPHLQALHQCLLELLVLEGQSLGASLRLISLRLQGDSFQVVLHASVSATAALAPED